MNKGLSLSWAEQPQTIDEELRKQLKKCVWLQFFNKSDILNMSWEINFVIWIKFYMKSIEVIGNATL